MKILHVNVAGIVDRFYDSFFHSLAEEREIKQYVYIPFKSSDVKTEDLRRMDRYDKNIEVLLSPIKTSKDRLMYFSKISKYFIDVQKKIPQLNNIDVIHAHSLYTDGGVAYKLHNKFGIPYVVAVRTTDTNIFLKYFVHLRPFMKKILLNASRVIFINPNLKQILERKIHDRELINILNKKATILPNGVDQFWIDNIYYRQQLNSSKIKLIHVGKLVKKKNQQATLNATKELIDRGYDVEVDIVGDGEDRDKLESLSRKLQISNAVRFHGFIKNKEDLRSLYRKANIFILPSYTETFGIAYVEAMSQGLPVIYAKNQGIDGYFKDLDVGFSVNPDDSKGICDAILKIRDEYHAISQRCSKNSSKFEWKGISDAYFDIYTEIVDQHEHGFF